MTRPKVAPEKRQRTAIACDNCKRRKQKCSGHQPCSSCSQRSLNCTFGQSDGAHIRNDPANKRRKVDSPQEPNQLEGEEDRQRPASSDPLAQGCAPVSVDMRHVNSGDTRICSSASRRTNSPSGDEEAEVYSASRMLLDPTGKLLYIGDAATLSFLMFVRMIVESTEGECPFTVDPARYRIVENTMSLPENTRTTQLLPPEETALILLDSFFNNTCGLVEVVNQSAFMDDVKNCYSDPLAADPSWLCLLYLVFATGLVLATPVPGTKEDQVIRRLRSEPLDRAEIFYYNAKNLCDPSTLTSPDVRSIQILLITALYMLAATRRNKAYALHGMAVRSAFALGLHREESMSIHKPGEQILRRNLWRSLFILDRFLSVSLGRPASISEDECSEGLLEVDRMALTAETIESQGLLACTSSCHILGLVLEKVYAKRKISTKLGRELVDKCNIWYKSLDSRLRWGQSAVSLIQATTILHVNLFYWHSIILLTRPFFALVLNKIEKARLQGNLPTSRPFGQIEGFSEDCLVASCRSIVLIQKAMEARSLSRRNPFVTYFLFSATLVVLCNEYSKQHSLHPHMDVETCISNSLSCMNFMAQADPQAERLRCILECFNDVVVNRNQKRKMPPPQIPTASTSLPHSTSVTPLAIVEAQAEILGTIPISPNNGVSPRGPPYPVHTSHHQQASPPPTDIALSYSSEEAVSRPLGGTNGSTSCGPDISSDFQTFSVSSTSTDQSQTSPDLNDPTEIDFKSLWNWPRPLSQI